VLEQDKGLKLPRALQVHFSRVVQSHADETGRELTATDIWAIFQDTYLPAGDRRFDLIDYRETGSPRSPDRMFVGRMSIGREERSISGRGNGPLSSVLAALKADCDIDMDILDYQEHAIGHGGDARAAAYVQCQTADGRVVFGVGIDTNVATASVRAVLSAANGLG
jgi:2-isopropylmalate synthase